MKPYCISTTVSLIGIQCEDEYKLVKARGSLQRVSDVRGKVSRLLGTAPQLLLAFGVEHVAHVVKRTGLTHLKHN